MLKVKIESNPLAKMKTYKEKDFLPGIFYYQPSSPFTFDRNIVYTITTDRKYILVFDQEHGEAINFRPSKLDEDDFTEYCVCEKTIVISQ